MHFSIITPSYNSGNFLEQTIQSVLRQREEGVELQYIVVDGGSTDRTPEILETFRNDISHIIVGSDTGPANAINKGLAAATGDCLAWLNADDIYFPGTLKRAGQVLTARPDASFCFGSCPIMDHEGREIRSTITRFKELFFPVSSRFTYQCINYLSQPALFFRKSALEQAGWLREDMVAAWDYDFILRLWRSGPGAHVDGGPLATFRWHEGSISGRHFRSQFREEFEAARQDAGRWSLQALVHYFVRWGIVGVYSLMMSRQRGDNNGK